MRILPLLPALAAAALATGAAAHQSAPAGQPTAGAAEAKPKKPRKICRRDEGKGFSRLSRTVCKTAEEWKADARRDEDDKALGTQDGQ